MIAPQCRARLLASHHQTCHRLANDNNRNRNGSSKQFTTYISNHEKKKNNRFSDISLRSNLPHEVLKISRNYFSNTSTGTSNVPSKSPAALSPPKSPLANLTKEELDILEEVGKRLLKGDFHGCISAATDHLKKRPQFVTLLTARGEACHHLGQLEEAKRDYNDALRLRPDYANAWKRLGLLFLDQAAAIRIDTQKSEDLSADESNKLQERNSLLGLAKEHLDKAIQLDPSDADAVCSLGLLYLEQKDIDAAIDQFAKATKTDATFLPSYRYLARIWHQRSQWASAIDYYTMFMRNFEKHYDTIIGQHSDAALFCDTALNRGICYLQFGDQECALMDFTAIISVEGDSVPGKDWAYHFRGRVYFQREEWSKVIDDNTEALKLNPMILNAYKDRAIAYEMIDRLEKAEEDRKIYLMLKQKMAFEGQLKRS